MRLAQLDNGQRGRARFFLWMIGRRRSAPDVLRMLMYRPNYFGRQASRAFQQVMRRESPWSVSELELFAAYTSRLNQCVF